MQLRLGVVYSYTRDAYFIFDNPQEIIRALQGNICISFYGLHFDTKLLLGNGRKWNVEHPFFKIASNVSRETYWQEFDLFQVILSSHLKSTLYDSAKKRSPGGLSLNDLCKHTIKKEKIGVEFGNCTDMELAEYCLHDVRITRELFEHALKNGFVRSSKQGRINVNPRYLSFFRSNIKI